MMLSPLLVVLAAIGATPAVDEFFAEFSAKRDHIERLEARFSQETVTPDEVTHSVGQIVYEKPRRILLRYRDPEVSYLVDGTRVYQYNADLAQVQIYDLDDDPQLEALFLGFDSDTSRLREAYTIGLFDPDASTCGKKGLRLLPLQTRDASGEDQPADDVSPLFQQIVLYLRSEDFLPCRIQVVNDEESAVEISVTDFNLNDTAAAAARIDLPEGTQVIENEALVETVGPGGKRVPELADAPAESTP
jgi:outer membrane lipoprotein-sorting protein